MIWLLVALLSIVFGALVLAAAFLKGARPSQEV